MGVTSYTVVDAQGLVQDFWGKLFDKELREATLWPAVLHDPNYTMERIAGGDTVKITTLKKPTSTIRTIGTDADTFDTNILDTDQVDLKVNKRPVSGVEFEDLAIIMSQLEDKDSEIKAALLADVQQQANDWIKGLISPSASTPDHVLTSVTDFNIGQLSAVRLLSAKAHWRQSGLPWYLFVDPTYYSDLIDDTSLTSSNITNAAGPSPIVTGNFNNVQRFGYNIVEDDSLATDTGFGFISSFMKVIMGAPRFKISDLHPQKKFGFIISCDFPMGSVQVNDERVISIAN